MRRRFLALLLSALSAAAWGQQSGAPVIRAQTTLITVPALVVQRDGSPLFGLRADDFAIMDNGVAQTVRLEETPALQPVSLAIVVQTGRGALQRIQSESCRPDPFGQLSPHLKTHCVNGLHSMAVELEPFLRAEGSELAIIGYDQAPTLRRGFTTDFAAANAELEHLRAGGGAAATLDALQFALDLLDKRPDRHQRRIIVLVCEKKDRGSQVGFEEISRRIAASNTEIYCLSFSDEEPQGSELLRAGASMLLGGMGGVGRMGAMSPGSMMGGMGGGAMGGPGEGGLRAQGGASAGDPWSDLLESYLHTASVEMKDDLPQGLADLNGGEYIEFDSLRRFDDALAMLGNHAHNRYQLSYRPSNPTPGAHKIFVGLRENMAGVMIAARTGYYMKSSRDDDGATTDKPSPDRQ